MEVIKEIDGVDVEKRRGAERAFECECECECGESITIRALFNQFYHDSLT